MDSNKQNGDDPAAIVRPIRPSSSDSDLLQINASSVNKKIKQSTRIFDGGKIIKFDDDNHNNYQNSTSDGGGGESKILGQQGNVISNDRDAKIVKPMFAVMPSGTYLATTMTMMSNDNKNNDHNGDDCGSGTKPTNKISSLPTKMIVSDKTPAKHSKKSFGSMKDKWIFNTLFDCWITRTDSVIDLSLSSKNDQKKKVNKKKKKKQTVSLNNLQDDNNDMEHNEPNHRITSSPRIAEFNTDADDLVEEISLTHDNNDNNNVVLSSRAASSASAFNHFVSQSEISIHHPNTPCSSRSPVVQSNSSPPPPSLSDMDVAFSNDHHLHQIQISSSSSSASSNATVGPSANEDVYQSTDGDASPPHLYEPYPMPSEMQHETSARRIKSAPITFHTQIDYINRLVPDLLAISNCSFYWGKMDRYEAERLLDGKPEGTFLLRDSAQEDHLFSVSFRRFDRSLHARIENWEHRFSFDSHDPGVFSSPTVTGLIEHYKVPSHCMFFEPILTKPLNRTFTFKLQHLARVTICDHVSYDTINQLPLPAMMKSYLKEYHYRIKVRTRHFDESLNRWWDSSRFVPCTFHKTRIINHQNQNDDDSIV